MARRSVIKEVFINDMDIESFTHGGGDKQKAFKILCANGFPVKMKDNDWTVLKGYEVRFVRSFSKMGYDVSYVRIPFWERVKLFFRFFKIF